MDLKELKRLADTLDDNGKRELIYFLQSRTKVWRFQFERLMKFKSRSIKRDSSARIAKTILLCDLGSTL